MEYNKGYIAIHRVIRTHWLWDKNRVFSDFEAWLDLIMFARWEKEPTKQRIGNKLYTVGRGEQIRSIKTLSKTWNWSASKTRRFLVLLESDGMIALKSDSQTTHVTICNYDTYQKERIADESQVNRIRIASEFQVNTIEERKEREEGNKGNKYTPDFESAWNLYGRRGGKKQAYIEWKKLTDEERKKVASHIPKFIMGKEPKYIRHFERYLKDGLYESEINNSYDSQVFNTPPSNIIT